MHNQPLQLQASIQMLPSADGYLAEITDPSSAWHGFFAFGSNHHAAQPGADRLGPPECRRPDHPGHPWRGSADPQDDLVPAQRP
jgi:hypothetical protein